jgi:protein-S-isoprenylcysteine O-methyltransferase Ste14
MSSLGTTNFLLATIAACLLFISGRGIVESAVPSANAQTGNRAMIQGCYLKYGNCVPIPVRVTEDGYVVNTPVR